MSNDNLSVAVTKQSLDIIEELSQPYSLTRQRLYLYIMIKRVELEVFEQYTSCIRNKRRLRRLIKRIHRLKRLKRKRSLRKRLLLALIVQQRQRKYFYSTTKKIQQYEFKLMNECNLYPLFPIERFNSLFNYIRSGVTAVKERQDNVTKRLTQLTVSELSFIESQIQLFSMPANKDQKNKIEQLKKSLTIGLSLSVQEVDVLIDKVVRHYSKPSQYSLNHSIAVMKEVSHYIKTIRLDLREMEVEFGTENKQLSQLLHSIEIDRSNLKTSSKIAFLN